MSIWHRTVKYRISFTDTVYSNELCHLAEAPMLSSLQTNTLFVLNAYTHCILNTKLECIYKSERTAMFNAQVTIETN